MRRGALGRGRNRGVGFTLVELLVATAIAAMLLALIASITSSATDASSRILDRLSAEEGAKVALEFMERDFDALASAEQGRTTLTLVQETLKGREAGAAEVKSFWIMLLSRPVASSSHGSISAISYRMVFTDPMKAIGDKKRLALYRTSLDPADIEESFLTTTDLHKDFWEDAWKAERGSNSDGEALLDDYLVENIVNIGITLTYRDADGALQSLTLPDEATINWTDQGFSGASIETPNTPLSLTVALTSLRPEGARSYELEAMTLEKAITKYGVMQSKTFSLHSGL